MSHHQHRQQPREVPPRAQRPLPIPGAGTKAKPKRLRTKRERDAAKFGPKAPPGGSRRGPPRWLQPPHWGGLPLGSPLRPSKPVVITQHRLCHRGLFNHEVKSLDVRRLLTPGPAGDGPPAPAPQTEERGEVGGVPAEALQELVSGLASLLGSFGVFAGRDLVSERRRSLLAALRRHRQGPPDLGVFLAHRTPAQPPGTPQEEARPGPPGRAVSLGGWEVGEAPAGTPSPLGVGHMLPLTPRTPSPIFGALRERENPFSWSSAEDEEDETPGGLAQTWAGPGGLLPPPPPLWRSPQPPQEEKEEGAGDEGWTPIAPPAFSPEPPPAGAPQPRDPRGPPRAPRLWRAETPWDPPGPSGSPWDAPRPLWGSPEPPRTPPRLLWDCPDPARAPPTPPRPSRAPQIWSPDPLRPLWDPPRPPWDPRPWSPELPAAVLDHPRPPRTPQPWNPEPPRAVLDAPRPPWDPPRPRRDPPDAPRPLWDSPDPTRPLLDPPRSPRSPRLWSPAPPWDPPALPRPPRDPRPWSPEPPGAPQNSTEPSRCCCRRLCRDIAQRHPLCHHAACRDLPPCRDPFHRAPPRPAPLCRDLPCRDPPRCCHQPPKRRRPDWGGVGGRPWGGGSPSSPVPGGCRCPCRGVCWGGPSR